MRQRERPSKPGISSPLTVGAGGACGARPTTRSRTACAGPGSPANRVRARARRVPPPPRRACAPPASVPDPRPRRVAAHAEFRRAVTALVPSGRRRHRRPSTRIPPAPRPRRRRAIASPRACRGPGSGSSAACSARTSRSAPRPRARAVIVALTDPDLIAALVAHRGLPIAPPPVGTARAPRQDTCTSIVAMSTRA